MSQHLWGGGPIVFGANLLVLTLALALELESQFFVCTIACEPVVGFLPNFHGYIIGT